MGTAVDHTGRVGVTAGMSRTELLQVGALGTLAALGLTNGERVARGVTALAARASGGLAHLRRSTFAPHVGSSFSVTGAESPRLNMKLTELSDLTGAPARDGAFSLLFTAGRRSAPLEAGIYRFDHPRIGRFSLFMSPVGRGVHARDYQAIINRIPG